MVIYQKSIIASHRKSYHRLDDNQLTHVINDIHTYSRPKLDGTKNYTDQRHIITNYMINYLLNICIRTFLYVCV